jgi:hypothetical protein
MFSKRMSENDNARLDHYLITMMKACKMLNESDDEIWKCQSVYYNY